MRIAVSAFAAVGVLGVFAVWPGAEPAKSSYTTIVAVPGDSVRLGNLNPYSSVPSGSLLPTGIDPFAEVFMAPPEAMIASLPPASFSLPQLPPPAMEIAPLAVETVPPAVTSEPAPAAAAAPNAVPDEMPKLVPRKIAPQAEAVVAPPKVQKRSEPLRRQSARGRPDVMRISFEGPAGAPFAHTRFCLKYPSECRVRKMVFRGGPIELTAARRQELLRVNAEVNRSIVGTAMNEPVAEEKWVISPKVGDCNDYAVTKRHKLIARGWPARALLLAEVVTSWGEHHLVLVVRTREGDVVVDNLNANIRNWTKTPYEWVRVESPVNPLFWSKVAAPQAARVASVGEDRQL